MAKIPLRDGNRLVLLYGGVRASPAWRQSPNDWDRRIASTPSSRVWANFRNTRSCRLPMEELTSHVAKPDRVVAVAGCDCVAYQAQGVADLGPLKASTTGDLQAAIEPRPETFWAWRRYVSNQHAPVKQPRPSKTRHRCRSSRRETWMATRRKCGQTKV